MATHVPPSGATLSAIRWGRYPSPLWGDLSGLGARERSSPEAEAGTAEPVGAGESTGRRPDEVRRTRWISAPGVRWIECGALISPFARVVIVELSSSASAKRQRLQSEAR